MLVYVALVSIPLMLQGCTGAAAPGCALYGSGEICCVDNTPTCDGVEGPGAKEGLCADPELMGGMAVCCGEELNPEKKECLRMKIKVAKKELAHTMQKEMQHSDQGDHGGDDGGGGGDAGGMFLERLFEIKSTTPAIPHEMALTDAYLPSGFHAPRKE